MSTLSANVHWRSIDMANLRLHPTFTPLPLPCDITEISAYTTLGLYRQDSWQWDALHAGRLTTSKLACCLGFFESFTSSSISIPRSLQSHSKAVSAWQQLRARPPSNWNFLCEVEARSGLAAAAELSPWYVDGTAGKRFQYEYRPATTRRPSRMTITSGSEARLAWGSAQEATAVLAALNYFASIEPGTTLKEAGLFTFEALQESLEHLSYLDQEAVLKDILRSKIPGTASAAQSAKKGSVAPISTYDLYKNISTWIFGDRSLPLIGASPDGIIQHADGRIEALEVKCISPFIEASKKSQQEQHMNMQSTDSELQGAAAEGTRPSLTVVRGFGKCKGGRDNSVTEGLPVWHVPQLMLEMLCCGAHCRSAVVVVLCISGARIFRLQRDDQYIADMMGFMRKFYCDFIAKVPANKQKPPPPNFYNPRVNKAYAEFLRRTEVLAAGASLVVELGEDQVQRSPDNTEFFV